MKHLLIALLTLSFSLSAFANRIYYPRRPTHPPVFRNGHVEPANSTYKDIQAMMHYLAQTYPNTTQMFDLGIGDTGDMIQGLKIGNGPINNLLVSTHHGNEYGATEVARGFAESMAQAPIAGQTMWIIPVLNISGYNIKERREAAKDTTFDPNRDYPGPCGTEGPFNLRSTHLLADFIAAKGIVASATLHTFTPAVVYPWGISTHDLSTPYDDIFKMLVQAATVESHYETGNNTDLIYPADGTFEDYAFWKQGIWSILFELGYSHTPNDQEVAELVKVNVPGLRRMYEQAPHDRAEKHDFTGKCDTRNARKFDRHDE